jgi:lysozyme family protein
MIAAVIKVETDKYTDIAGDKGGPTKDGISLRYLRGVGLLKGDFNHDGVIDKFDVMLVNPTRAAELYKEDFYFLPHINALDPVVQPVVFDVAVNSGAPRAIMLLQKAIRDLNGSFIAADGVCGPATVAAEHQVYASKGSAALVNEVVKQRLAWYDAIVRENPVEQKFLDGWKDRANSFRV